MMLHTAVLLAAAHLAQPAAMPQLNVEPSCRAATNLHLANNQSFASCMRDEAEAKDQVAKSWTSYPAAARARCSAETMIGGDPSYVELYTCLDMDKSLAQQHERTADQ
jgi:hypothetical protein